MRRFIILLLLLCSITACLFAEAETEEEQLIFSLLNAEEYNLSVSISTVINRFYGNVEFSVDKDELAEADFYSFFIAKLAYIERIKVNGKAIDCVYTHDLDPLHFVPELEQPELLAPDSPVFCISLCKDNFSDIEGTITISLEYKMILPEWKVAADGREKLEWSMSDFFFPRNLVDVSEVNIQLLTTIFHTVDNADSISDNGTMRTIRKKIVDIPGQNEKFILYKALN
jgi:hypothetical protein